MADGILTSVVRAWDARGELDSDVLAPREGQQDTGSGSGGGGDGVGVPGEAEALPSTSESASASAVEGAASSGSGSNGASTRRITKKKHIIVAPAMNTAMWRHPVSFLFVYCYLAYPEYDALLIHHALSCSVSFPPSTISTREPCNTPESSANTQLTKAIENAGNGEAHPRPGERMGRRKPEERREK